MISITRYHDISCGHRVVGHEGKCRGLHGHNYRIHFTCAANTMNKMDKMDKIGRVIDFSVIKSHLCEWLEQHWDHKMLLWDKDPIGPWLNSCSAVGDFTEEEFNDIITSSLFFVPFNPTAENMANWLLKVLGPRALAGTGVMLVSVNVEETRKCNAMACI